MPFFPEGCSSALPYHSSRHSSASSSGRAAIRSTRRSSTKVSLVAFLAWVGLGADGLSSLSRSVPASVQLLWSLAIVVGLIILNLRGVKESVQILLPIFLTLSRHARRPDRVRPFPPRRGRSPACGGDGERRERQLDPPRGVGDDRHSPAGLLDGGRDYTGIEAVSNGLQILREPRVQTGKRTMNYMAISLALTAGGLILCYLLADVHHVEGLTLNAVLIKKLAVQAGFLDGPRVLSKMALDSWVPHRFSLLSDRLVTQNGILVMGGAALGLLVYTRGAVGVIVAMYSINVFLTFLGFGVRPVLSAVRGMGRGVSGQRSAVNFLINAVSMRLTSVDCLARRS